MTMRRLIFLLPLALFLIVAGYFALSLRPGRNPQELPSAMIDKPMPKIDLPTLDGTGRLNGKAFKGRVVMVNFFASWCVPCRAEQPILLRLKSENIVPVYGIAYKDKVADTQHFLAQLGDPFQAIGVDQGGKLALDFGVYGVPETYVIDTSGRIRYRQVGPVSPDVLEGTIFPLIQQLAGS
jgi:cytochrome c biogenesis protein CcmG/thiol:disulfide interchange protein DsbE